MKMRKLVLLISMLVGAGAVAWATQQTWRHFIVHRSAPHVERQPDGRVGAGGSMVGVLSNDPKFTQAQADEQWVKMKEAIAEGHYKLRGTTQTNGVIVYCYDITLADGKVVGFGSSQPMEEIERELMAPAEADRQAQ